VTAHHRFIAQNKPMKYFSNVAERNTTLLLALCQGFLLTNTVILMAVNGLTGYMLAENKAYATIPAMTYVVGSALAAMPVSAWMKRVGRRTAFMQFACFAIVGSLVCAYAVSIKSFWLLCAGTFFIGWYAASGALYRFAAADAATPDNKARAISFVLIGGILGGLIGPESSKLTKDWLPVTFAGTYLSLAAFAIIAIAILSRLNIPDTKSTAADGPARPLSEIAKQPTFIVAVIAAAFGYGVMNLLMVATPLAMGFCGHPYKEAVFVLEWHIVGMFLPSLFTGSLIKRFGVANVIGAGALLNFVAIAINISGTSVTVFWFGLFVLGVGWNFLYIGGTTLLTQCYRPSEKNKVQGFNDAITFATMAVSSSSSGVLVNTAGWLKLNYVAAPFIVVVLMALVWFVLVNRRTVEKLA
jgi:predicted MFS family arabinose efflux permease